MNGVFIQADDLRLFSASKALKRNIESVPVEELEKFVEQFNTITA